MSATSVTSVGLGLAGDKVSPVSNIEHVLNINSANNGDTIADNVTVVFVTLDDDFEINLPMASTALGRSVVFQTSATSDGTLAINDVYGSSYEFSEALTCLTVMSNGKEWVVSGLYTD